MSFWNKASEFATNLKNYATNVNESKSEVDLIKTENEELKKSLEEQEKKYENIMKEINEKENQAPLSDNEFENLYYNLTQTLKNFILSLLYINNINEETKKNIPSYKINLYNDINEVFINTKNENFIEKLNSISNEILIYIYLDLLIPVKSKLEEYLKKDDIINILKSHNINEYQKLNNITFHNIIENLCDQLENSFKDIQDKKEKIDKDEDKIRDLNAKVSELQLENKEILNKEKKINEIMNNLESENKDLKSINDMLSLKSRENENKFDDFYKDKIELENKLKIANENNEKLTILNNELNNNINIYMNENIEYKNKVDELQKDIIFYNDNNEIINEKNIEICKKDNEISNLKSTYSDLELSKENLEKEKLIEVEVYKNQILEMSNELSSLKEDLNLKQEAENIEKIYLKKIQNLENIIDKLMKENLDLNNKNSDIKKEMDNLRKKVNNDLKDTEFLIDKRVISSVLVSYFDKNNNNKIKQSLLETLSHIMQYSNEDRAKMGLPPIRIPVKCNNKDQSEDKLKKVSDGLYDFIMHS